jgi:hypothetical protein
MPDKPVKSSLCTSDALHKWLWGISSLEPPVLLQSCRGKTHAACMLARTGRQYESVLIGSTLHTLTRFEDCIGRSGYRVALGC